MWMGMLFQGVLVGTENLSRLYRVQSIICVNFSLGWHPGDPVSGKLLLSNSNEQELVPGRKGGLIKAGQWVTRRALSIWVPSAGRRKSKSSHPFLVINPLAVTLRFVGPCSWRPWVSMKGPGGVQQTGQGSTLPTLHWPTNSSLFFPPPWTNRGKNSVLESPHIIDGGSTEAHPAGTMESSFEGKF